VSNRLGNDPGGLPPWWWELHLRKARGEQLSEEEQSRYDAEMTRQDQAAPLEVDLETTCQLLQEENETLRRRIAELERLLTKRGAV
jgi:hypothetical protein